MREIKIGVSISLSGRYMAHGSESFEGLNLWVNDANQSGGITIKKNDKKLPINLIYYDDGSSVENCKMLVERLIVKDKVDILIGPYSSGLTLGAAPIVDKYKKILWNHGGSSDEIFERGYRYIVSTITPASEYLTGVIDMVKNIDRTTKKLNLLYAEDSGFSNSVADGAKRHGEETGFQIVEFKYRSGENDFSLPLQRLKEESFDII
ncbi:MAG TPA: ABC transporter substrate-binding protein, partial [Thermodesulfobacteriota bacterium]